MSRTIEAELNYGYDLAGGGDAPWRIAGLEADQEWCPSWLGGAALIDQEDPQQVVLDRLLEVVGRRADGSGWDFSYHGPLAYARYKLTAYAKAAYPSEPLAVSPIALEVQRRREHWDDWLDAALMALEITPTGPRGWFLTVTSE